MVVQLHRRPSFRSSSPSVPLPVLLFPMRVVTPLGAVLTVVVGMAELVVEPFLPHHGDIGWQWADYGDLVMTLVRFLYMAVCDLFRPEKAVVEIIVARRANGHLQRFQLFKKLFNTLGTHFTTNSYIGWRVTHDTFQLCLEEISTSIVSHHPSVYERCSRQHTLLLNVRSGRKPHNDCFGEICTLCKVQRNALEVCKAP